MQASSIPTKIDILWAADAGPTYVRPIPDTVQQPANPNAASFPAGFPPDTFIDPAAGGVGPDGRDMNGILQVLSAWAQWQATGGPIVYDAAFQSSVGGYPNRAVVGSATTPGAVWVSTADNNVTNPDTGGAGWADFFAPVYAAPVLSHTTKTRTVFTSGSGSYVPPAGCRSIFVRLVGGGGGAEGAHSTSFPVSMASGRGGNTTFGALTAGGGGSGGSGTATGGCNPTGGGTTSGGSINLQPSPKGAVPNGGLAASTWAAGGQGGSTPLGFGGNGLGDDATGYGGGGGGGYVQTTTSQAGVAGQGGGYLEAVITNLAGSYAYSVGAAGTPTSSGIQAPSNATGGIIIIDENY